MMAVGEATCDDDVTFQNKEGWTVWKSFLSGRPKEKKTPDEFTGELTPQECDYLTMRYEEDAEHARLHETLRAAVTGLMVALIAGLLTFAVEQKHEHTGKQWVSGILICGASVLGLLFNYAHYARYKLHRAQLRHWRRALENGVSVGLKDWARGIRMHYETRGLRLYLLWRVIFIFTFAIGVIITTLSERPPPSEQPPIVAQAPAATQTSPAPVPPAPAPQPPVSAGNSATPAPLSRERERALKPKDTFTECANCPEVVVVPAGSFMMGSPASEKGRDTYEGPQHRVTFDQAFAVSQFAVTFDEWDACVGDGGCNGYTPADQFWGRGRRPVITVSWDDARAYVTWLSRKTGKTYRLLSEAEYEYAARAGTTTYYPWGNDIGRDNANCDGCGSQWDNKQTAPVGSFAPNQFGLYDMVGNVGTWTEDCYHNSYSGAPIDGLPWTGAGCTFRVVRGGSWLNFPQDLRSALRFGIPTVIRNTHLGFRVGRTLTP
jgi:formylglycine-generating enzyme required for sulfatase activity